MNKIEVGQVWEVTQPTELLAYFPDPFSSADCDYLEQGTRFIIWYIDKNKSHRSYQYINILVSGQLAAVVDFIVLDTCVLLNG